MAKVPYSGTWGLAVNVSAADQVLPEVCRALWIDVAGAVAIIDSAGNALTFGHVPVGFFPVACLTIKHTGTTATGIIAIF